MEEKNIFIKFFYKILLERFVIEFLIQNYFLDDPVAGSCVGMYSLASPFP